MSTGAKKGAGERFSLEDGRDVLGRYQQEGKPAVVRELTNLPFEAWVIYIFDHPMPDDPSDPNSAHWSVENDDDSQWWDPLRQPEVTVAYLTKLFENATHVLTPLSDAQIKAGLWSLLSGDNSDHIFVLLDPSVPWPDLKHCISSMYTLFEWFFAPRCSSHLDEAGANILNGICYMWWDILPIYGKPGTPNCAEINAACLYVMRMTLDLDSDACRESALHGLGHWRSEHPKHVEAIIDRFLDRNPDLRSELKAYAREARRGMIL